MKDTRPFEGIMAEQASDGLRDQTRHSIPSWDAGLQRDKVTRSVVGSCHVILLHVTESHCHELTEIAAEKYSTSTRSTAQLIMFHKNTFEPGGVETEGVIQGTSKQCSFGPEALHGQLCAHEGALARKMHVHTRLCSPEQHDRKEAINCTKAVDIIGSDFNTSAYRERGKAKLRSTEDAWGEMLLILPPDLVPMWSEASH